MSVFVFVSMPACICVYVSRVCMYARMYNTDECLALKGANMGG